MPDIMFYLISALVSLIVGGIISSEQIKKLLRRIFGRPEPEKTYSERLSKLTHSLTSASGEVDSLLNELSRVAKDKEASIRQLQEGLESMEMREKELKNKIQSLEEVPLPVADHFAEILESREKRSVIRDYMLFGAGVVVSTVIAIIIQLLIK